MFGHFGAVEADFQSYYGLDLRDVLWGEHPMGVRRIVALVNGLPMQGAVFRDAAMHGKYWTTTEELLATLIEVTDLTNRLLYGANAPKGKRVWDPLEIERPAKAKPERALPTPSGRGEIQAFFWGSEAGEVVMVDG